MDLFAHVEFGVRFRSNVFTSLLLAVSGVAAATAQLSTPVAPAKPAALAADYGKLPLSFEANQGQSDPRVRFLSRGNGYSLFLTDKAAVLALTKAGASVQGAPRLKPKEGLNGTLASPKTDVVRMELAGAARGIKVEGAEQLPGTANYFIGNDRAQWHTNVPTFAKVKYAGVFPGVDLVYYGNQRQLEYDFVVAPGSDPGMVKLHFAGAETLRLTSGGDLMVVAKNGEIAFHKPVVYQASQLKSGQRVRDSASQRELVDGRFVLLAGNSVGFAVGKYDGGRELVIDPTLAYSTYLGGTGSDVAEAIVVDSSGSSYVTGYTMSANFPTKGSIYPVTNAANGEAFVSKFNPAGTALIYSTYLGGSGSCAAGLVNEGEITGDVAFAIAVDSSDDAYVTGRTCSSNFPTVSPVQPNNGKASLGNAFVTKLNPAGSVLIYSTYLGGSNGRSGDWAQGIAVDGSENAYVVGQVFSNNFITTKGAFQTTTSAPNNTGFVTKFSASGSVDYSTYLGNSFSLAIYAVAVDSSGNAYVTGEMNPGGFPVTSNAFQPDYPGSTVGFGSGVSFLTKFNSTGTAPLLYSTYLGGSGVNGSGCDCGRSIAVANSGNAYIGGSTQSHDFPVHAPYQSTNLAPDDGYTGFVSKIDTLSGALVYSTYLGGSLGDEINGIAIDAKGDAFVTGFTYSYSSTSPSSNAFPTTSGAFQAANNGIANKASNAFLTELNPAGGALIYSTYLGGSGNASARGDAANGIALDSLGNAYIAGSSYSTKFPTLPTSFQPATKAATGNSNAFVSKFAFATATKMTLTTSASPVKLGTSVTFTADVPAVSGSDIVPTGTVTFVVNGGTGTVVTLDDTGQAAFPTTSLPEGVDTITATYSGDADYSSSSATLAETVYGPAATVTVVHGTPQTSVYGTAFPITLEVVVKDSAGDVVPGATVTFAGTGLKFSATSGVSNSKGEVAVTATPIAVGSLTATASAAGAKTPATFTLTATKAPLTITATNVSVAYNAAIPTLTYTATGFVNGDTSKVLSGAPAETTTATKGSLPGTYPITITAGTLAAPNYALSFVNGTLTVTPLGTVAEPAASQTVTITDATNGWTVYYTMDGTTPTTSSTQYTGPITVTKTTTLKFIAVKMGYTASKVRTVVIMVE